MSGPGALRLFTDEIACQEPVVSCRVSEGRAEGTTHISSGRRHGAGGRVYRRDRSKIRGYLRQDGLHKSCGLGEQTCKEISGMNLVLWPM